MTTGPDSASSTVGELAALGKVWDEHRDRLLAMIERRIDSRLRQRVGADHLGPGPTNAVLEQPISQVRDRGEQKISDGARRSTVHALASYILSVAGSESG